MGDPRSGPASLVLCCLKASRYLRAALHQGSPKQAGSAQCPARQRLHCPSSANSVVLLPLLQNLRASSVSAAPALPTALSYSHCSRTFGQAASPLPQLCQQRCPAPTAPEPSKQGWTSSATSEPTRPSPWMTMKMVIFATEGRTPQAQVDTCTSPSFHTHIQS